MIYIIFLVSFLFTYIYSDIIVYNLFFGYLNILPSLLSVLAAFISAYVAWKTYSLNKKISEKENLEKRNAKKTAYNNCVILLELKKSLVESNIKAIDEQKYFNLFKIESKDFEPIISTTVKYSDKDKMSKIRDIIVMTKKMNKKINRINELNDNVEKITLRNKDSQLQQSLGLWGNNIKLVEIKENIESDYNDLKEYMINLNCHIVCICKYFLKEADK